ncbi:hypothetical protein ACNFCJ_05410 [Pseudomonas sp. NY15364]|uniref:hypothetical protein n=1 Tax=Pseudomonas sp. NY15364 TaxID=3400353 RepID=UPI003A85F50B
MQRVPARAITSLSTDSSTDSGDNLHPAIDHQKKHWTNARNPPPSQRPRRPDQKNVKALKRSPAEGYDKAYRSYQQHHPQLSWTNAKLGCSFPKTSQVSVYKGKMPLIKSSSAP